MHLPSAFLLLLASSLSAAAAAATLCNSNDRLYFSCSLGNKKIVSVCGANDAANSYLQYRTGMIGQMPELVIPSEPQSPGRLFSFGAEGMSAKGGIWNLAFQKSSLTYTIYRFRHSFEPMFAGVAIKNSTGKVTYLACDEATVIDKLSDLEDVGLPRIQSGAIVRGPNDFPPLHQK